MKHEPGLGDLFERGVVKADNVYCGEGRSGVGTAFIVAKLDFDRVRGKNLDDRSHLAAHQTALGQIAQQSNLGEQFQMGHKLLVRECNT